MLDFKDLVLPDDLRQALNRGDCQPAPRHLQIAEANLETCLGDEDSLSRTEDASTEPEETEVVLTRMAFDRPDEPRDDGPIRSGLRSRATFRRATRAGSRGSNSGLESMHAIS